MTIGEAAKALGVHVSTLRRWEEEGRLVPERTKGGQRRYLRAEIVGRAEDDYPGKVTIAYARVSSRDQKKDLETQKEALRVFCTANGWSFEVISDLGSGMNYRKKGLRDLLSRILDGNVSRLVVTHKDRLLRFGAELVFAICEERGVEVVIMNRSAEPSFEEDLATDVLEIITVFSARLYGSRSRRNKKLIDAVKGALDK